VCCVVAADQFTLNATTADFQNNDITTTGALSKGSGTWLFEHVSPLLAETHNLAHSFSEASRCDNVYRATVQLVDGKGIVDLDKDTSVNGMTDGTFTGINKYIRILSIIGENTFDRFKGVIDGKFANIESENPQSNDVVDVLIFATRNDPTIIASTITDDNGDLILEPLKPVYETKTRQRSIVVPDTHMVDVRLEDKSIEKQEHQKTEMKMVVIEESVGIDGVIIPEHEAEKRVGLTKTIPVTNPDGSKAMETYKVLVKN